ncbi:serine hydrolase domain-containing protein [Mesorhizobium shangrilense]|uniref:Serine hydrolase domain-containing protein n=1 Tax=Mesorhizobium shangrilense TaxID=460060 RepID=A0ABV2DE82_9HYPH
MDSKLAPNLATTLEQYLASEMEQHAIPGLGVTIARDGHILHVSGYGLANVEHNVRATPDTLFHSGSTGKMFTAAAVLMLIQDGRIGLDHLLKRYIPEGPESWNEITISQLLSMTSGLGNFAESFAPMPIRDKIVPINQWQDHSDEQLIALAALSPLLFAPGESYAYSNIGYVLTGLIIARICGKPYYEFLRERLFQPIGMASAREASWFDIVPNRAAGHSLRNDRLHNNQWTAPTLLRTGDGGLYFSPRDIAHWFVELDSPRMFNPDSIERMFEPALMRDGRPAFNGYALGWQNSEARGHRKIRHGGTWDGFRAEFIRFPTQRLSVAVLANLEQAQVARIGQEIAGLVEPAVAAYQPIAETNPGATQRDDDLLRAIAARRASRDAFSEKAWQEWSHNWFEQALGETETDLAAVPLELVDHVGDGAAYKRRYRLPTGRYHMHWMVQRAADGRVTEMRFHME